MYTGKKCCKQQLRRVDKALPRAGDIRGERLYAVLDEVGKNSVTEYKSGTN